MTTNIFPPTFGYDVGDMTWLSRFDLTVPTTAQIGDTITITPSEGALENLIVNETFDNVAPQHFRPATVTVVPEPTTAVVLTFLTGAMLRLRRRSH